MGYKEVTFEFPDDDDTSIDIEPSSAKATYGDNADVEIDDDVEALSEPKRKPASKQDDDDDGVEILDDTPEEDRDRKPIKYQEPTDEEMSEYSDKVQSRIRELTKNVHDARRVAEAKSREQDELTSYAQRLVEENRNLREGTGRSNKALLEQARRVIEVEIGAARKAYSEALDAGNTEEIVKAEEALADARYKKARVDSIRLPEESQPQKQETSLQQDRGDVQQPQSKQVVDAKAQKWRERNEWFDKKPAMRGFAYGCHTEMVEEGYDPRSDEYYEELDSRMRKAFPSELGREAEGKPKRSASSVVASVDRSTSSKKLRVTKSGAAIAKRLGVPLEEYAKQMALLGDNRK